MTGDILPRDVYEKQRMEELRDAIRRYYEAEESVPGEWLDEFLDLLKKYDYDAYLEVISNYLVVTWLLGTPAIR